MFWSCPIYSWYLYFQSDSAPSNAAATAPLQAQCGYFQFELEKEASLNQPYRKNRRPKFLHRNIDLSDTYFQGVRSRNLTDMNSLASAAYFCFHLHNKIELVCFGMLLRRKKNTWGGYKIRYVEKTSLY